MQTNVILMSNREKEMFLFLQPPIESKLTSKIFEHFQNNIIDYSFIQSL